MADTYNSNGITVSRRIGVATMEDEMENQDIDYSEWQDEQKEWAEYNAELMEQWLWN